MCAAQALSFWPYVCVRARCSPLKLIWWICKSADKSGSRLAGVGIEAKQVEVMRPTPAIHIVFAFQSCLLSC